jgi:hypothetical protein
VKRGVAFIREIVARRAVASIARWVYNEQYVTRSMAHRVERNGLALQVCYSWTGSRDRGELSAKALGEPATPADGSEEQFIADHYWGYSTQTDGRCWSIGLIIRRGACGALMKLGSKVKSTSCTAGSWQPWSRIHRLRR